MTESHIFQNAQGFVIENSQFVVSQAEKRGLQILLEASIPAAAYDSSEHPRHCHPGTRYQYIDQIVNWGLEGSNRGHHIFWLKGPAGVGKSAIAQSCAEELATQKKLAAAFFFSRPNQREDPQRLFTSISYQWASKRKPYAEILKSTIHDDPTIVNKALPHQFHHLFVSPLQKLVANGEDITERVVIIDGLDECAGVAAQRTIVEIIAASIRDSVTPFIWLICSRLEPHLVTAFNTLEVSVVTHQEELTVSRDIDNEIAKYLTDELAKIGREHDIPLPWPHERDIGTLINLSSGLFIYANTVVRFIGDHNSLGPETQLRAVVALAKIVAKRSSEHPLSELDSFYLLIIQRIPAKVLQTVQWILLATIIPDIGTDAEYNRQLLGLSRSEFRTACRTLHSVMKIEEGQIVFYHASFMDCMQDPQRSREFCIRSGSGLALRTNLMQRLQAVCNDPSIRPYSESFYALIQADRHESNDANVHAYENVILGFFSLFLNIPRSAAILTALACLNFERMAKLWVRDAWVPLNMNTVFLRIPKKYRSKIVQSCKDRDREVHAWEVAQMPRGADWDRSYILGHSQHKCFCWYDLSRRSFTLRSYYERPTGKYLTAGYLAADLATPECPTGVVKDARSGLGQDTTECHEPRHAPHAGPSNNSTPIPTAMGNSRKHRRPKVGHLDLVNKHRKRPRPKEDNENAPSPGRRLRKLL
ncbi:hypothetical protein P691DRAFT_786350 [Macrolepiota fuliginosa MF-IS2]|uniref:Nephrocystin 3-like N-terminal domain-containing protein n=1 Tax=Macrolepiota fuliginosa MF-IS2 TaxID=1400762 RepID=A0A9P6C0J7_9AGAR|nr:hypothetical protein P691DRAFT_786350 [Macrolepiota fuliginosa MF-IS2]